MIFSGEYDNVDNWGELDEEDRTFLLEDVRNILFESKYTTAWEADQIIDAYDDEEENEYACDY